MPRAGEVGFGQSYLPRFVELLSSKLAYACMTVAVKAASHFGTAYVAAAAEACSRLVGVCRDLRFLSLSLFFLWGVPGCLRHSWEHLFYCLSVPGRFEKERLPSGRRVCVCVYPLELQGSCRIVFLNLFIAGERGMIVGPHSTKLPQSFDTESDQLGVPAALPEQIPRGPCL